MSVDVGELIQGDLFDQPGRCANPESNFVAARARDSWLQRRLRDAEMARDEANHSLAILTIASEVRFEVLDVLDNTTQEQILAVRNATPGQLLAELAVRQMKFAKK